MLALLAISIGLDGKAWPKNKRGFGENMPDMFAQPLDLGLSWHVSKQKLPGFYQLWPMWSFKLLMIRVIYPVKNAVMKQTPI